MLSLGAKQEWWQWRSNSNSVLSVGFEVGVSLLLAPAWEDKRGPKAPFPLVEDKKNAVGDLKESIRRNSSASWVLLKVLLATGIECLPSLNSSHTYTVGQSTTATCREDPKNSEIDGWKHLGKNETSSGTHNKWKSYYTTLGQWVTI